MWHKPPRSSNTRPELTEAVSGWQRRSGQSGPQTDSRRFFCDQLPIKPYSTPEFHHIFGITASFEILIGNSKRILNAPRLGATQTFTGDSEKSRSRSLGGKPS
jgi:hypothetical protein